MKCHQLPKPRSSKECLVLCNYSSSSYTMQAYNKKSTSSIYTAQYYSNYKLCVHYTIYKIMDVINSITGWVNI